VNASEVFLTGNPVVEALWVLLTCTYAGGGVVRWLKCRKERIPLRAWDAWRVVFSANFSRRRCAVHHSPSYRISKREDSGTGTIRGSGTSTGSIVARIPKGAL